MTICRLTNWVRSLSRLTIVDGRPRPREELYDLCLDPLELTNVADLPAYAGALTAMQQHLDGWLRDMDDPAIDETIVGETEKEMVADYRRRYEARHAGRAPSPAGGNAVV